MIPALSGLTTRTVGQEVEVRGRGVHSGELCLLRILPAPPGAGVRFRRIDLNGQPEIQASVASIQEGELQRRTTLAANGARIFTVEHVLSAFRGLQISDAVVEMDSSEPPFLDGSAAPLVELCRSAGVVETGGQVQPVRIEKTLVFRDREAEIVALPSREFRVTYFFTSDHPLLRAQSVHAQLSDPELYAREIAPARTFCFVEEIETMRRAGLIKGASLASAVVFGRKAILNENLRFADEAARHKILDFVGDLALLGRPLLGHFLAWRSGHRSNCLFALHLTRELGL